MERGEWEEEPDYPRAPIPAHERTWRHPSELGREQWLRSEPPLVVGRGLSVATGTVGAILALGLLWLMIPHRNSNGVAVEGSSTSTRTQPTPTALARETTSTPSADTVAPASAPPVAATTTTAVPTPSSVSPAASEGPTTSLSSLLTPVPTMMIDKGRIDQPIPAVAIALRSGHYVVTTTAAVNGRDQLEVQLPNGQTVSGSVVSADPATGAAVVAVQAEVEVGDFELSDQRAPVNGATVLTPDGASVRLWEDDGGVQISYGNGSESPGEGVPVVDSDGRLMGLCTQSDHGVYLVGIDALISALDEVTAESTTTTTTAPTTTVPTTAGSSTTSTTTGPPQAWLGIRAEVSSSGAVTVIEVTVDGPAAAAGIAAGDTIAAVDETPVTDLATLTGAITSHAPGDVVTLTIVKGGTTEPVDVEATLTEKPWSL